jgi:CCR4-NOT transcription complex subunit 7/8
METTTNMKKEIENPSNEETQQMNGENISSPQKIVLKKNIRHLIQNNNNIENENNINKEEKDNNINDKKDDEKNNKKEEKGYLDDDLDDEDNIKLYLRVIKRMEKTYGVPVISAKIPSEQIKDIEIEEDIRPILINNENESKENKGKNISNKKNIYINNIENNSANPKITGNKIQQKIEKRYNYPISNNKNNRINYNYNTKEINKHNVNNPMNYNANNKTPNYKYIINYNKPYQYISNSQNKAKITRPYQYIYKPQNIYNNKYNINRPHQYIYNSPNKSNFNNNRHSHYSINVNSPSYNKNTNYNYIYHKGQRNAKNRKLSSPSNMPYNNYYINSKLISNKIPISNNQSNDYLHDYENPLINLHKKYENAISGNNDHDNIYKIMYKTRYHHENTNNLIGNNLNEYCSIPKETRKYNNIGKNLQLYDSIQRISPRKYDNYNFNKTRKTYCIHNNRENIHWYAKANSNKNNNDSYYTSNLLLKNGNPIIPKSTYIQNYKINKYNIRNRYLSSLSFVPNNKYRSPTNYLSHNRINYLNKSHNMISFNGSNKFKELLQKYNSRRRKRYNSPNPLNRSHKNINVDILKKRLGNTPRNYIQDDQFNFSYDNNSFNFRDDIPHDEEYLTYCIY